MLCVFSKFSSREAVACFPMLLSWRVSDLFAIFARGGSSINLLPPEAFAGNLSHAAHGCFFVNHDVLRLATIAINFCLFSC